MVESKTPANPLFLRDEELPGHRADVLCLSRAPLRSNPTSSSSATSSAGPIIARSISSAAIPATRSATLLSILKVTKQSISRVLKDLLEQGYVEQKMRARDRRERLLWLTEKGIMLERELTDRQSARFARAYREDRRRLGRGFPQGPAGPARSRRTRHRRQGGARAW